MGTTLHAWLKLVANRMPEPLVNMGTEKTAANRVFVRGGTPTARHLWYRSNLDREGDGSEWLSAAIHLSVTVALLTSDGEVTTIPALLTTG